MYSHSTNIHRQLVSSERIIFLLSQSVFSAPFQLLSLIFSLSFSLSGWFSRSSARLSHTSAGVDGVNIEMDP